MADTISIVSDFIVSILPIIIDLIFQEFGKVDQIIDEKVLGQKTTTTEFSKKRVFSMLLTMSVSLLIGGLQSVRLAHFATGVVLMTAGFIILGIAFPTVFGKIETLLRKLERLGNRLIAHALLILVLAFNTALVYQLLDPLFELLPFP